ncbi:MAG: YbaB/EbfC family nucleoid-associated protein [Chlamydiota bacterium]
MKKQAKLMQEQFSQIKDNLANTLFEGSAGNGLVTVTLNGAKELKKLMIKPECVNPTDVEGLQDLILSAFEDASSKIESQNQGMPAGKMPWG